MKLNVRFCTMIFACAFLLLFLGTLDARAEDAPKDSETTAAKEEPMARPFLRPVDTADECKSWATLGRLYVIVATDDLIEGVQGTVARNNGAIMEKMIRQNVATGAYAVVKIPADKLTRQTIFAVIANLPLKPQDAVCLYFSGKGDVDRRNGGFFGLSRGKEEIYRSEIRNALAKKGCRLEVLISDVCDGAALPPKPEPKQEEPTTTTTAAETPVSEETKSLTKLAELPDSSQTTAPLFFSLFFQSYGTVDIMGALPNRPSLPTYQGNGCFTETLQGLFVANRNKYLSWYRVFPYLNRGTELVFEWNYPTGATVVGGITQKALSALLLTLTQDDFNAADSALVYPHGNNFSKVIPGVTEGEVPLSDADRKAVSELVRDTFEAIRPQNDSDKGTHEDFRSLDPDNTVNGIDGEPFSTALPSIKPPRRTTTDTTGATDGAGDRTPPPVPGSVPVPNKKPSFGVRVEKNTGDGVKITELMAGLPGANAGLEVGDVILTIDGKKVNTEQEYSDAIDAAGRTMALEVRTVKRGNIVKLPVKMPAN